MTDKTATLVRLGDTDLTLANDADDVRGRTVLDRNGEEVGEVDGLIIDKDERRVRFLLVASGGFLGLGKQKLLVPVDTIAAVDATTSTSTRTETTSRVARSTTPT